MPNDTELKKQRQKREAVQGILFFSAMRIAAVILLLWSISLTADFPCLQAILLILMLAVGIPVLFVGTVLRQRFQEIEGGEFDAAAKY